MHLVEVITLSTNDYAKAHDLPKGSVVVSPYQKGGKGRAGRKFVSAQGGAYFSIVRKDDWDLSDLPKYMMAAPLAVVDALAAIGIEATIKYPNDVLVGGAKICGVLIETTLNNGLISRAIIGIGVNVNNDLAGIDCLATSVKEQLGREYDVKALIADVCARLDKWLALDRPMIAQRLRGNLVTLGKRVKTDKGEGVALALRDDGTLVVRQDDRDLTIGVGDVIVLEEVC